MAQAGAHLNIRLQTAAAQVEITIFEASDLADFRKLRDHERRNVRFGQNVQTLRREFDLARRQVAVDILLTAGTNHARDSHDELVPEALRVAEDRFAARRFLKGDLQDARAISEVGKDQVTEVAVLTDETEYRDLRSDVRCGELRAHFGSFAQVVHSFIPSLCSIIDNGRGPRGGSPARNRPTYP